MKWNKTLSTEEIALLVTGLDTYKSLSSVKHLATVQLAPLSREEIDSGVLDKQNKGQDTLYEQYLEATEIKEALEREVYIVDPHNTDIDVEALANTNLVISIRAQNEEGWISAENCLITRESAALWFYELNMDMAKKLCPHVETLAIKEEAVKQANKQAPSLEPNLQTELRTSEQTLLDSIGIVSLLLSKTGPLYKNGGKPNAKQIADAVKQEAIKQHMDVEKISNLERDITKGLKRIQL
jgi:hypothetical protein